jgi:hypothetical protein
MAGFPFSFNICPPIPWWTENMREHFLWFFLSFLLDQNVSSLSFNINYENSGPRKEERIEKVKRLRLRVQCPDHHQRIIRTYIRTIDAHALTANASLRFASMQPQAVPSQFPHNIRPQCPKKWLKFKRWLFGHWAANVGVEIVWDAAER